MEKSNRKINIFYTSLYYRIISEIIFHILFVLQTIIYFLCYHFTVIGRKNLKGLGSVIFISNHAHYLDPGFIAEAIWPKRTYFSGLESTFQGNGIFSLFIRCLGGFPIPEEEPGRIIRPIGFILKKSNRSIHVFPEGELVLHDTSVRDFKPGAFLLAQFFDVPIVPITIKQKDHRFWPFPKITMIIGNPLNPSGFKDKGKSRKERELSFQEAAKTQIIDSINS